jgi:hypothetical protein
MWKWSGEVEDEAEMDTLEMGQVSKEELCLEPRSRGYIGS